MTEKPEDQELGVFFFAPTMTPMGLQGKIRARKIGRSCDSRNLRNLFGREMFPTAIFVQGDRDYRQMIREVLIGMVQPVNMAIEFIPSLASTPEELGITIARAVLAFAIRNPGARSVAICASTGVIDVVLDRFCADMGDNPGPLTGENEYIVIQLLVSVETGDAIAGNVARLQPYIRPM